MLVALALAIALQDPVNDGAAGAYYSYLNDLRYAFVVSREDVARSPRWDAAADSPPLPPRAAMDSARRLISGLLPDGEIWTLSTVSLRQIMFPDVWLYVVEFHSPPPVPPVGVAAVGSFMPSTLQVVVLMTGEAVSPVVSPRPR